MKKIIALLLIGFGALLLLTSLGYLDSWVWDMFWSWQTFVAVFGIYLLLLHYYFFGSLLTFTGLYFFHPWWNLPFNSQEWLYMYWGVVLLFLGLYILLYYRTERVKPYYKNVKSTHGGNQKEPPLHKHYSIPKTWKHSHVTQDGYAYSANLLGEIRQKLREGDFSGANINNILGSTVLDLRKVQLKEDETSIYLHCILGGIIIYIPEEWNVVSTAQCILGQVKDMRQGLSFVEMPDELASAETKKSPKKTLHIHGFVLLGGVEIKD